MTTTSTPLTIDLAKLEKRKLPKEPTETAPVDTLSYFRGGGLRVAVRAWNDSFLYVNVFNENNVKIHGGLMENNGEPTAADIRTYISAKVLS